MTARAFVTSRVAGLHVTEWPGPGRTILGLPGLGNTACTWATLAATLPDARVVSPDLRGRGGSVDVSGPTGLRAHATDVSEVMAELDLTDVVVVGHSMGAYLAPLVASLASDRIAKLVLLDGGIRPKQPFFMRPTLVRLLFHGQLRKAKREWPDVESFARRGKFDKMIASRPDLRPPVMQMLRAELGDGAGPLRLRVAVEHAAADAVDTFFGPDVEPALDALTVPTEVLLAANGRWDGRKPFISAAAVDEWRRRQPLLSIRRLPANHLTVLFAPEVAEAVRA